MGLAGAFYLFAVFNVVHKFKIRKIKVFQEKNE
jgi:hypothetical protein